MWIYKADFSPSSFLASQSHAYVLQYLKEIDHACNQYQSQKLSELPFSLYRGYDTDGERIPYETAYFNRRGRLTAFAVRSWLYHNKKDICALEDVLWAVCNEFTWALPAHLDGNSLSEQVNPVTIDLFAAETAQTLSEILSLLSEYLSPIIVRRCYDEIFRRVLNPFLLRSKKFAWEQYQNNWCAVCGGCIGMCAVYLLEEDQYAQQVLHDLSPILERFLASFSDDGVCLEGLTYWNYGMTYFVALADLIKQRFHHDFMDDTKKLQRIASFPFHCCLNHSYTVSFSDGSVCDKIYAGLLYYLNVQYSAPIPPISYFASFNDDACHRFCRVLRDIVWFSPKTVSSVTKGNSMFPQAQWAVLRGKNSAVAIKGGYNDEPHNHNDIASFHMIKNKIELISDLGAGMYTKDYFNDNRYQILCNRSGGHSVPIIDGAEQSAGKRFHADRFIAKDNHIIVSFANAYDDTQLRTLIRNLYFDYEKENVQIADTYTFTHTGKHICERLITKHTPVISKNSVSLIHNGTPVGVLIPMTPVDRITTHAMIHHTHSGKTITVHAIDFEKTCQQDTETIKIQIK